jgi:hypothetical protein
MYLISNIFIRNETETIKANIGVVRKFQKEQGYFDGRFVARTDRSKKLYTRKRKHINYDD